MLIHQSEEFAKCCDYPQQRPPLKETFSLPNQGAGPNYSVTRYLWVFVGNNEQAYPFLNKVVLDPFSLEAVRSAEAPMNW